MADVRICINGKTITASSHSTILEAARANGIYIPTLCAYEGMKPKAACKLCIVDVEGEDKEKLACASRVKEGMVITVDSDELFAKRKKAVQEMFRQHKVDCHHCLRIGTTSSADFDPSFCESCFFCDCVRDGFCELQSKALEFGVDVLPFEISEHDFQIDQSCGCIIRNPNKCVKCRRCVELCKEQGVGILSLVKTEKGQSVGARNSMLADGCVRCGRCVSVCPTGALFMREHIDEEIYFAHQYDVQTAVMLDADVIGELEELFKLPKGSIKFQQLVDGLKKIGIDQVYDAKHAFEISNNQAADMLDSFLHKPGRDCAIMAGDYAAKCFLEQNYPQLKSQFVFYDSAQKAFSDYMRARQPAVKLYHIANRNCFGAEAYETGAVDYFINARELYRIFLRTGVAPLKRKGIAPQALSDIKPCKRYEALINAGEWSLTGGLEELSIDEGGNTYKLAVCTKLSLVKEAVANMDKYHIIKVIG